MAEQLPLHILKAHKMNEEELILNNTLIEKCQQEGIVIALVAINRKTKEIELPQNLSDKVKDPDYYVCYCHRNKSGEYIVEKIDKV